MNLNQNISFADREDLKNPKDSFGRFLRTLFQLGVVLFPWIVVPGISKALEQPREVFLFAFVGIFLILYFLYSWKKGEFEWRRTKLNWIFGVWIILLGLIFLYSKNHKIAWEGYPGSMTGGFSEYLAFIIFYLLSIQLFTEAEWKRIIQYFLISVTAVLTFFILATIYFKSNAVLTINFARTPTLVTASSGVVALALWWVLKRAETLKKSKTFILVLALFFVSSLLDFYLSWWMWVAGTILIIIFDFISRREVSRREQEARTLGINNEKSSFISLLFHGDSKYLFLILLFALSRSLSPVFLKGQKIDFMPFFSYLTQYPTLGQKVFFYLILNLIVFCFGLYYFWKLKKERASVMLVLAGIMSISVGYLFYYTESTIYLMLNWILLIYAGLTFLRKAPEKDYLYFLKSGSQGRKIFIVSGILLSLAVVGLIIMKIKNF